MEMQNFVTLQVQTFDPNANSLRVSVPAEDDEVSVETLHSKVCENLGLKKTSWKYFSLFQGLNSPVKKFKAAETLLVPVKDISLQKWCFDPREEKKLIKSDSQAAHLLCLQAQHEISSGKLQPSDSEKQKLDVTKKQCIVYFCFQAWFESFFRRKCILVPQGRLIFNRFETSTEGCAASNITWYEVLKWVWNEGERTLTYTIQLTECSAPVVLRVMTVQAEYLLSATLDGVWALMADDDDSPMFHASMIKTLVDRSKQWDNCIFDPSKADTIKQKM